MSRRTPLVSDKPIDLLDHLEVCALTDPDGNASVSQLKSDLGITGSVDAIDEREQSAPNISDSDYIEAAVEAAFTEAEYRIDACGSERYPFDLKRNAIFRRKSDFSSIYTFLLGLSQFGEAAVPGTDAAKLFEEVCAHASRTYFGCAENPAEYHIFGFPRRIGARDFCGALEELCSRKIREGKADKNFPTAYTKKDAGLDIVTWRPFPDRRSSKLIAFGQCATGKNWWGKRYELQPETWCRTWMTKQPHLYPLKMFFVPHAISSDEWAELGYAAGIIFDRFRVTHYAEKNLPESLRSVLKRWSKAAFAANRNSLEL